MLIEVKRNSCTIDNAHIKLNLKHKTEFAFYFDCCYCCCYHYILHFSFTYLRLISTDELEKVCGSEKCVWFMRASWFRFIIKSKGTIFFRFINVFHSILKYICKYIFKRCTSTRQELFRYGKMLIRKSL